MVIITRSQTKKENTLFVYKKEKSISKNKTINDNNRYKESNVSIDKKEKINYCDDNKENEKDAILYYDIFSGKYTAPYEHLNMLQINSNKNI